MPSMRRPWGAGTSFAFGLVVGLTFAALVWRLTPLQPSAVATPGSASGVAAGSRHQLYTTAPVPLTSSPGGAAIATLAPATPLAAAGERGGWVFAEADLYRSPDSPTVLFQDPARFMRTGLLTAPDAASTTGTVTIDGSSWQQVHLAGWVPAASTSDDLADIWVRASFAYDRACGRCHAVYPPGRFAARQWVSQFRAMVPRTSLTPAQADLILKWLQAHARH